MAVLKEPDSTMINVLPLSRFLAFAGQISSGVYYQDLLLDSSEVKICQVMNS